MSSLSPACWHEVYFGPEGAHRKSSAFQSNSAAVAAWLLRGEILAREISTQEYDSPRFRQTLRDIRALTATRDPVAFRSELERRCAAAGVAVVAVPELPGTRLSGAARWLTPTRAIIQLSSRHKSDDQVWFAFFHEAAHILLHGKRDVFVDARDGDATEAKEAEANRFAADFLIPPARLQHFLETAPKPISCTAVQEFAAELGIALGIVVGRLQHEGASPRSHCNALKQRIELIAAPARLASHQQTEEQQQATKS